VDEWKGSNLMNAQTKAKDQYGIIVTVLKVVGNVVYTTNGIYHITKLFALK
jgi:hypothetical protein